MISRCQSGTGTVCGVAAIRPTRTADSRSSRRPIGRQIQAAEAGQTWPWGTRIAATSLASIARRTTRPGDSPHAARTFDVVGGNGCFITSIVRTDQASSTTRKTLITVRRAAFRPGCLQPRIDGLALQREDAEHALMNAPQWFALNESLQTFDTQSELT